RLDPRADVTQDVLGNALQWLRRLDEAKVAVDAAIALQPSSLGYFQDRVMIQLARGDLNGARTALAQPPAGVDQPTPVADTTQTWRSATSSARCSPGSRRPRSTVMPGPGDWASRAPTRYRVTIGAPRPTATRPGPGSSSSSSHRRRIPSGTCCSAWPSPSWGG